MVIKIFCFLGYVSVSATLRGPSRIICFIAFEVVMYLQRFRYEREGYIDMTGLYVSAIAGEGT